MANILAAVPIPSSHVLGMSTERDTTGDCVNKRALDRSDGLPEGGTVPSCRRLLLCRQVCVQDPVRAVADLRCLREKCE